MGRGRTNHYKIGDRAQVINPALSSYLSTGVVVKIKGKYPSRMIILEFSKGQQNEYFPNELKKIKPSEAK